MGFDGRMTGAAGLSLGYIVSKQLALQPLSNGFLKVPSEARIYLYLGQLASSLVVTLRMIWEACAPH